MMLVLAGTDKESLEMQMATPPLYSFPLLPPTPKDSFPLVISCSSRDTVKLHANSIPLLPLLSAVTGMI